MCPPCACSAADPLAGLMGSSSAAAAAAPAPKAAPAKKGKKSFTAFEKNGLTVVFNTRQPTPSKTQVQVQFSFILYCFFSILFVLG